MVSAVRGLIMGAAGLGAAAAGVFGVSTLRDSDETADADTDALHQVSFGGEEICLKADIDFIPGDQNRCFTSAEIAGWRIEPLIDPERGAMAVTMRHPTDGARSAAEPKTCRDYGELRYDGWYAPTSREMRREAFFVRACGVIEMLMRAQTATTNHFADDGLELGEVASISADRFLRLGAEDIDAPGDPEIERISDTAWRVAAGGQTTFIEEIAVLDFDNDGIAEILAFFAGGPDQATARLADIALLEKDADQAAVTVTAIDFGDFYESKAKT